MIRYKVRGIKFGDIEWEFSYDKELFVERRKEFIGACNINLRKIFVESTLPTEKAVEVLKHELTHAYVFSCINKIKVFDEQYCKTVNESMDWRFLECLYYEI